MNVEQANNLDFPTLLSHMGFEPVAVKKGGNEYWYNSPFRKEKDASFHISKGHTYNWVWKDFGDEGGTLVDFVMHYQGHKSFKQALSFIRGVFGKTSLATHRVGDINKKDFSFHRQAAAQPPENLSERELEFIKAEPIKNPAIYAYLKSRAIPRNLMDHYLEEIHYKNLKTGKKFFAFGMKNQSNGYEIRAASDAYSFKSALISRDITVIKGSDPDRRAVNIVEGMTDFLSLVAMFDTQKLAGDTIILHSLSSHQRASDYIKQHDYQTIHTFLDNNLSGQKHTEKFKEEFSYKLTSQSHLFAPHEDLNDWLKTIHRSSSLNR